MGFPTVFIRLTGCPLRCQYCDTAYAFSGGMNQSLDAILDRVKTYPARYVTVTGGEPLAQPGCIPLLTMLCDAGYQVSLETSGAMDISNVDSRVMTVLDIKTPDSNEVDRNLWENLSHLRSTDHIKFVICSRADYEWSRDVLRSQALHERCEVLFSPSYAQLTARQLAEWIVEDGLPVRFQIQLHKMLWGEEQGR